MSKTPTITIKQVKSDIHQMVEELLQPFSARLSFAGKSVLIKPNLVEPQPYTTGQTTNPALIEAVIFWCKRRGAGKVAIGEGPNYFQPQSFLRDCFTKTGVSKIAERLDVSWILFDEGPFRKFKNYSPRTPQQFSVSEHAFCWDYIINIPVPKPHYLTRVSIAMKNLKGFIKREDKPSFHYGGNDGIHGAVTDLNLLIRPVLNIVDGTAPVHHNKNFVLAGTDIVAVDAVTTSLMGLNPGEIKTITMGYEAGLGEMDLHKMNISGDDLKNFTMNIEQPESYLKRAFPRLHLCAQKACSGCLIPLFSALHQLENSGIGCSHEITLIMGKDKIPDVSNTILSIGECTRNNGPRDKWLGGCPPSREEIVAFLLENLK